MSDGYIHRTQDTFKKLLPDTSGNEVNGLGVEERGTPQPFFWHPPDRHAFGDLQQAVIAHQHQSPDIAAIYSRDADRGPRPLEKAEMPDRRAPEDWAGEIKAFARSNEADLVGITPTLGEYVYEGYELPLPNLIIVGVAMDHTELSNVPSSIDDMRGAVEVGLKYNQAARAARKLSNRILAAGYDAKAFPGPHATALNMIPAAIAAGFGELGKHGSMINSAYGSSFRLSAVATDMPLVYDEARAFGADEFCMNCQVCSNACPPDAIFPEKQTVRGRKKWYVDFDKCIPYFGETFGCAICIAVCPWSRPGVAPNLIAKLARRRERLEAQGDA